MARVDPQWVGRMWDAHCGLGASFPVVHPLGLWSPAGGTWHGREHHPTTPSAAVVTPFGITTHGLGTAALGSRSHVPCICRTGALSLQLSSSLYQVQEVILGLLSWEFNHCGCHDAWVSPALKAALVNGRDLYQRNFKLLTPFSPFP